MSHDHFPTFRRIARGISGRITWRFALALVCVVALLTIVGIASAQLSLGAARHASQRAVLDLLAEPLTRPWLADSDLVREPISSEDYRYWSELQFGDSTWGRAASALFCSSSRYRVKTQDVASHRPPPNETIGFVHVEAEVPFIVRTHWGYQRTRHSEDGFAWGIRLGTGVTTYLGAFGLVVPIRSCWNRGGWAHGSAQPNSALQPSGAPGSE